MLARFFGRSLGTPLDHAVVPIRLLAGIALAHHGWGKINNPFHWMDSASDAAPAFLQSLAALSEFGGGIALALGLLVPLASFGIACTMGVAMTHHWRGGDPFVGKGGWELAGLFFSVAVLFLVAGPGRFSADAMLSRLLRKAT